MSDLFMAEVEKNQKAAAAKRKSGGGTATAATTATVSAAAAPPASVRQRVTLLSPPAFAVLPDSPSVWATIDPPNEGATLVKLDHAYPELDIQSGWKVGLNDGVTLVVESISEDGKQLTCEAEARIETRGADTGAVGAGVSAGAVGAAVTAAIAAAVASSATAKKE